MKTPHLLTATLTFLIASHGFGQGALNPPPGAPAPTMKSLDQVEPRILMSAINTPGDVASTFIISAPGSYYLTGNFIGEPGKHGISIQANDVTLDLNGFALISGGGGATRGVNVPALQTGICIRNGNVRGWTGDGIHGQLATLLVEKLSLTNNTGAIGLAVSNGSLVKDCVASGNDIGFKSDDRAQLGNCIATVNNIGFSCTSFVTLLDCTASRGNIGISVQSACNVLRCSATRNTVDGIEAGSGSTIADCIAGTNSFTGIATDTGSTVRNCTTRANGGIGISFGPSCHVTGNTCDANNRGISTNSNGSLIDGNNCTSNPAGGYNITGNNNLFIRNSAHGNTPNFSIGIQAAGSIVDMTGGGTITSTSPWANFSY